MYNMFHLLAVILRYECEAREYYTYKQLLTLRTTECNDVYE